MEDPSEVVANFVAITGADEGAALTMLEATGYNLEQAVQLHFAAAGDRGGMPDAALAPMEDDEALARRLQQEASGGPSGGAAPAADDVRAPLPVYKQAERLVGDEVYRPTRSRGRQNPVPYNVVDAFRDFKAECGAAPAGEHSLAALYEPPRDLIFHGNFEEAKQSAHQKGRWLIVNLQSTTQFGSHQLNRDTWRNDMVRSLVEENFVLFQAYDTVEEGQRLQQQYRLYDIPATLVVDPVTGAPMRQWTGFVDAERLIEDLMPFLEHSIHDPQAARLARRARSRKEAAPQTSGLGAEDEELQRALELSMAGGGGGSAGGGGGGLSSGPSNGGLSSAGGTSAEEDQESEPEPQAPAGAAASAAPSAAEVQAEATARLPEEPADGGGCRVGVRLPDGRRLQRRFPPAAPVAAVYDLLLSASEEAAGGRAFTVAQAFPGAPGLEDRQQSVDAAGLHGAMLVLRWQD